MNKYYVYFDWQGPMDRPISLHETFEGTWEELGAYVEKIKKNGCFNVSIGQEAMEVKESWQ